MIWPGRRKRVHRKLSRIIGLNLRGRPDPEVFLVCQDVFGIIEKMLSANQAIGVFSRHPRFEFEEVLFILNLLGALVNETREGDYAAVELWISEA